AQHFAGLSPYIGLYAAPADGSNKGSVVKNNHFRPFLLGRGAPGLYYGSHRGPATALEPAPHLGIDLARVQRDAGLDHFGLIVIHLSRCPPLVIIDQAPLP